MSDHSLGAEDSVFVRGLEFEANHGYYEEERRTKRRFRVHVELIRSLQEASESDKLADTIDYFEVCRIVLATGTETTFKLLETLAGSIASQLRTRYPQSRVSVEIEKLAPPCPGVPQSCGVRIVQGP